MLEVVHPAVVVCVSVHVAVLVFMLVVVAMVMVVLVVMLVVVLMAVFMLVAVRMLVAVLMLVLRIVSVVVAFLLLAVDGHGDMRAGDAALHGRLLLHADARKAERVQFFDKAVGVRQKLQQCGGQHVARRAHAAVQI